MRHYLLLSITMTLAHRGLAQDIVFPKHEESPQLSGNDPVITERVPVYIPERCPENMLLYPGSGEKSSWVCDCKPKYLYFPMNNTCYEAYRQGPCLPGNYVHLPEGEVLPRCVANPCTTEGFVPFNGGCYALETRGPCNTNDVLRVDPKTFKIHCTIAIQNQQKVQYDSLTNVPRIVRCPPGYRETPSGQCRLPL